MSSQNVDLKVIGLEVSECHLFSSLQVEPPHQLLRGRGQFADVNSNEDNARWALGDAARLLESRTRSVEELADFFESGVATAGDVVARLER